MNPVLATAVSALLRAGITEFLAWRERKARDENWKPSPADLEEFLATIDAATPEAVLEQARRNVSGG